MRILIFAGCLFLFPILGQAACEQEGYVGAISFWNKGGFNYVMEITVVEYIGGESSIGLIRIINATQGNPTPGGDLEDRKDLRTLKQKFETAYLQYSKIRFNVSNRSQNFLCNAYQNEEVFLTIWR